MYKKYIFTNTMLGIAIFGLFTSTPAVAQGSTPGGSNQWQYSVAIYLWGADIGGATRGGNSVEVPFDDLVDNLEMGMMGAFEARNNKWSILSDVIYLDIAADKTIDTSIPVGPGAINITTSADLGLEGWVFHLAGGYNLVTSENSHLDLVGGLRYLDLDMDLRLSLAALGANRSRDLSASLSGLDGIIGLKGNIGLGERWYLPYYVDMGIGESDFTWQATGGIGFRAAGWVDLALVYRHLEWSFKEDRAIDDLSFSGPAFGAIFHF